MILMFRVRKNLGTLKEITAYSKIKLGFLTFKLDINVWSIFKGI